MERDHGNDTGAVAVRQASAKRDRVAAELGRGIARTLAEHGCITLPEFTLRSGRRVDLIGLDSRANILVVEIKSSLEDFRSDRKWLEYLDYCDRFYFAVPAGFPAEVLPPDTGLIVADGYGAATIRESEAYRLNAARRRALVLRFALVAGRRLQGFLDPAV